MRKSKPEKGDVSVLPGSNRYLVPPLPSARPAAGFLVALGGWSLASTGFGGRSLADSGGRAGAGIFSRALVLPPLFGQGVQKLLANLGRQGSRMFDDLRVLRG